MSRKNSKPKFIFLLLTFLHVFGDIECLFGCIREPTHWLSLFLLCTRVLEAQGTAVCFFLQCHLTLSISSDTYLKSPECLSVPFLSFEEVIQKGGISGITNLY